MKKKILSLLLLSISSLINAQSWDTQNTGFTTPSRGINEIDIVSASVVWALAYDGANPANTIQEFTKTQDGGTIWTPGNINIGNAALQITNLSPNSRNIAWAGAVDTSAGMGGVWKTIDGGITWTRQNASAYSSPGSFFNVVHFFDALNGFTMGDPIGGEFEIYLTNDGGTTWTAVNPANIPNPVPSTEFGYTGSFAKAGNSLWFTTSKGFIYRTTDMGLNWSKFATPLPDFGGAITTTSRGKLYFSDNLNGVILGTTDSGSTFKLYTTIDGGATWNAGVPYAGGYNRELSYVPNTIKIYATGLSATAPAVPGSSYSLDNGVTFIPIDSGIQRGVVSFFDDTTGWCGGFNTDATTGGIYKFNSTLGTNQFNNGLTTLKITPNPTIGNIKLTGATITEVAVFDLLGKKVHTSKYNALTEVNVDLSSLQSGIYMLKATNDIGQSQTAKIIKN